MIDVNTTLFFGADDGVHGVELWKSNGTEAGTSLVGDIHPTLSSNPANFTLLNSRLFFTADNGSHGGELWALDINLANQAPTADAGGPYDIDEGTPLTLQASATDDDTGLTYTWSVDSPLCTFVDPFVLQSQITCADNGSYTATLVVTDWWGVSTPSAASIAVANVQPAIQTITLVPNPGIVSSQVDLQASYSDPGSADTHTASIDWGDGTVEPATVDQWANTLTGSHLYTAAGDYLVVVTVTDDDAGMGSQGKPFTVVPISLFMPILVK
jgi:ELWxxDGT repeat protein